MSVPTAMRFEPYGFWTQRGHCDWEEIWITVKGALLFS